MSADDIENEAQGRRLGVDRQRVRRWRNRWSNREERLREAEHEDASDKEMEQLIVDVLTDEYRSGVTPKFTPEQVASIIAVGCEAPSDSGVPISH
jgi:hypothetical protein